VIGPERLNSLIMGPHWGIDNYRPFNYLPDFTEKMTGRCLHVSG